MARKKRKKVAARKRVARKAAKKTVARRRAAPKKRVAKTTTREAKPAAKKRPAAKKKAANRRPAKKKAATSTNEGKKRPGKKQKQKQVKQGKRLPKAAKKQYNKIGTELEKSKDIAENVFDISDLSRVDASRPTEVQNVLNQHQAQSDPFSAAYAGRRSGQLQNYVSRLNDYTQGYDAQELNALRESRRREIDRGFQSGRAALARGQNNYRLGATQKAAQLAELAGNYGRAGADAENDLFIQGAAEKRRALDQYGNTVRGLESDEFQRGQTALGNYTNLLNQTRADELERQKINLGQEAADRAAQSGAQLGILQLKEARQNAKKQNKLIREGYKSNERIAGASQPSQPATQQAPGKSYADALNELAEQYRP